MKKTLSIIIAFLTVFTLLTAIGIAVSADGETAFVTATVDGDGVAAIPEGVNGDIGTLYVPYEAVDLTGLFAGRTVGKVILKGIEYPQASLDALRDAAPLEVYYNRPATGACFADELASAEGITLKNILGAYDRVIRGVKVVDNVEKNVVYTVGKIAARDDDFDDLSLTVTFEKPGMDPRTITQSFSKIYTTVRGVATTDESSAAAQGVAYVEDAAYIFALSVTGIPNGCYASSITVNATTHGVAVTSGEILPPEVIVPQHDHQYAQESVAPAGEARGYVRNTCTVCGDEFRSGPYDYSQYAGVDFESNGKFLIPVNFDNAVYTIEATVQIPPEMTGRPGVVVGNYGSGAGFNFEVYTGGKPRLYFAVQEGKKLTGYNYYFNTDVRSQDPVNMTLTFKKGEATLYLDGEFVETLALDDFDIPAVGRTLVMGGDCRSGNSAAFKGTMYSLSIFRDFRTEEEIKEDLILADRNDANCIVSYNLLSADVLGGGVELSELEYAQVHNAEELAYYASVGVKELELMNDIVLDRTVYVVADVTLYANGDYTITRDPDFYGDMFVVGENSVGRNLILEGFTCRLTLGKEGATGSVTIDGNKNAVTGDVFGTIVYINNSGILEMNDQATLTGNRKTSNARSLGVEQYFADRIGGAAIININGSVRMNGGVISYCEVNYDDPAGGDTEAEDYQRSCYGGAVFNYSDFEMNGGSFVCNTGCYGGAIANFLNVRVIKGVLDGNNTSHAGGAIYVQNDSMRELVIGSEDGSADDVIFTGNYTTASSGGAVYCGTKANLLIYGGTTFEGNHTYGNGGAVYVAGAAVIKGSTNFRDNYCGGAGGAIYVTQDTDYYRRTVRISDATFENNEGGSGGAIGMKGSDTTIDGCFFSGNSTRSGNGGAIYVNRIADPFTIDDANHNAVPMENGQGADVTITDCYFDGNVSMNEAGAIFGDAYCTISVSDSTFTGNTAKGNGGAISLHGTALTLNECDFTQNTAGAALEEGEEAGPGAGGAIYASYRTVKAAEGDDPAEVAESSVTINGGCLSSNRTQGTGAGGAISALTSEQNVTSLTASAVTFSNNEAGGHGGAVSVSGCSAVMNECTFIENVSALNGGAIYLSRAELAGDRNEFDDNVSNNANYGGGAVYVTNSTLNLFSPVFAGNEGRNGGAVAGFTDSSITLSDLTAYGNTARNLGGFAYLNRSSLTVTGSSVIGSADGSESGNTSNGGGAIYAEGNAALTLDGATLAHNSTTGSGGAIYCKMSTGTISNCTISDNTARYGGAAIIYGSDVSISGTAIENNTATAWGGALYIRRGDSDEIPTVTANDTSFTGNAASNTSATAGGAIYLNTFGVLECVDCVFENNLAEYIDPENVPSDGANGGAIYMNSDTALTVSDTDFIGNTASTLAGALYVSTNCTVDVTGGTFDNNSAGEGGAIFSDRLTTLTAENTIFRSNASTTNGGAISSHGTTIDLTDCVFDGNTTGTGSGAALYASYRTVGTDKAPTTAFINGGSFSGNAAGNNGGAIYATNSTVEIDGSEFVGNHGSYGGCLSGYSGSTFTVKSITATENTAVRGSFAYANASVVTVTADEGGSNVFGDSNDETKGNSSTGGGGVFFAENGAQLTVKNAIADNSTTNGSGGFIYAKAPTVVEDCIIGSSSASYGGVIIVYGTTALIKDTVIDGSTASGGMGGAIYLRQGEAAEGETAPAGVLTLERVTITNAVSVGGSGGAIYANANTELTVTESSFENNTSDNYGGAIYTTNDLTVSNSTFRENAATNAGGAIYLKKTGGVFLCTGTSFYGNNSKDGGAVWTQGPTLEMTDVLFLDNTASGNGGGAYLHTLGEDSFIHGIIAQNNSGNLGGWAYVNRAPIAIAPSDSTGVLFGTEDETLADTLGNTASSGGAIYATYKADLVITDARFGYNNAKNGGAITCTNDICDVEITGSSFTGNNATSKGGAILAEGAATNLTLTDTAFTANGAPNGGAIYLTANASYTGSGCTYENNTATTAGGAIYVVSTGTFSSTNDVFTGNSAPDGGAIYTNGKDILMDLTLNDVTLTNNSATGSGGAIYAYYINFGVENGLPMRIHGITAQGNTASAGGVFYVNRATVDVDAGTDGALLGTVDADLAAGLGNKATSGSGAVSYHTVGGYLNLDGATVGYNSAATNGGVAYVYHADGSGFTAADTTFVGNTAKSGGAFYAANIAVIDFTDCAFTGNSAQTGGAIYAKDAALVSASGCSFTANRATTSTGGAMESYVTTPVTFTDCVFEDNYAKGNGGALRNSNASQMTLTNVTFRNNDSDANGDAVFTTHGSGLTTSLTINGMTVDQPSGSKTIFISQTNTNVTIYRDFVTDVNHSPVDFSLIVYGSSASVVNNSVTYV